MRKQSLVWKIIVCSRFRKRWGGRYGKAKLVSTMTHETLQRKVCFANVCFKISCAVAHANFDAAFALG